MTDETQDDINTYEVDEALAFAHKIELLRDTFVTMMQIMSATDVNEDAKPHAQEVLKVVTVRLIEELSPITKGGKPYVQ